MKKETKCSGWRIAGLLVLLTWLGASRSYAQMYVQDPEGKYVSAICVDSKSLSTDRIHYLKDQGYTLDADVDVDLNKGVSGSDYVYVGYKSTSNPLEAITDIIVVYCEDGSYSGENKKTVRYNGRTYYPADYGPDSKGGNLNRGKSGAPDLYLYYTKDRSAAGIVEGDTVVTKLKVAVKSKADGEELYARMWYAQDNVQPNADLNKGAGGKYIYLAMNKHVHRKYTEDRADHTWKCGCGYTLEETEAPSKSMDGYYTINNYAQFLWFCDFVNGENEDAQQASAEERCHASARLNADIDLKAAEVAYARNRFKSLGWRSDRPWQGHLAGEGHTIRHLTVNDDCQMGSAFALVGYGHGCEIRDLTLADVDIQSHREEAYLARFVAFGTGQITLSNCRVSGNIVGDTNCGDCVAGIANMPRWEEASPCRFLITSCLNSASITGTDASGILGKPTEKGHVNIENGMTAVIDRCVNEGTVRTLDANGWTTAISSIRNGEIRNCLNTGSILSYTGAPGHLFLPTADGESKVVANVLSTTEVVVSEDNATVSGLYVGLSADRLSSGELCYLLNESHSEEDRVAWFQTLGTDDYPHPGIAGDIVYRYVNCARKDSYTNYGMYAEDMDHGECVLAYDFEHNALTGEDEVIFTVGRCIYCGTLYHTTLPVYLKSRRTVLQPSCQDDGLEELCYEDRDSHKEYLVYKSLEHKAIGQHAPAEGDGYTYCSRCRKLLSYDDAYVSDRTKDGVFEIGNAYDLLVYNILHSGDPSPHFSGYDGKLTSDIKLDMPYEWKPMNLVAGQTFDGCGKTISGFYDKGDDAGFVHLLSNACVKNLDVRGAVHAHQGALLCAKAVGGAVIENCCALGTVTNQDGAAGICYEANGASIVACRNYATVESENGFAAGIVGTTASGAEGRDNVVSRTANYGRVIGRTAAGLIAENCGYYVVSNCANYATIEGYDKVGGLFAEVASEEAGHGNRDARICISVGQTRILAPSNYKGAVVGLIDIPSDLEANQMDVYFAHSQARLGQVVSGIAGEGNVRKTSDETFASGEICIRLNEANFLHSKELDQLEGKPIWGQKIGVDRYPTLFSDDDILYKVEANGSSFLVCENQVLSELCLQDKHYFHSPTTFYVKDITYDRSDVRIRRDFYATLYLPFAFEDPDLKVMEFDHYDAQTGHVYLNEVDQASIVADKPYLIRLADNCDLAEKPLVVKGHDARISPSHDMFPRDYDEIEQLATGFYGTYAQKSVWSEANFYCISTKYGDFRKARKDEDDGTRVYPFRSVFKLDGGMAAPAKVGIATYEEIAGETGLDSCRFVENGQGIIYNLNGLPVGESRSSLKPGIYVQGGKKVIIK